MFKDKYFLHLIIQRSAMGSLSFLLLQQLIVASSSFWIIAMMEDIQLNKSVWSNLTLLLGSLILPYFPGAISLVLLTKWKNDLVLSFAGYFVEKTQSNQRLWANRDAQEEKISILSHEGTNTITMFVDYIYELISTVTNVVFNIAAISFLITYEFSLGYLVSLALAWVVLKLQKHKQKVLTEKAQISRIRWTNIILESWDNIVLGNRYNFHLWNRKAQQVGESYKQRNFLAELFNQTICIAIALLTFIPSFFIIIQMIARHSNDVIILGSITVILPRLFVILNYTYEILRLLASWPAQTQKLSKINKIFIFDNNRSSLESRISWDRLQCTANHANESIRHFPNSLNSINDVLDNIQKTGRITIRGENGSGKSSLLLLIKENYKDDAFLLPVKHQLRFCSKLSHSSTGQSLKKVLKEIKESVREKVILLDEWDANLDQSNQKELSHLIDEIAKDKCIIEVRHR